MDDFDVNNEEQKPLSKEKNKQELKETLSFFLRIALFILMIYVTFHLVAYAIILYPSTIPLEQHITDLKNPDLVFLAGMLGIAGMAKFTFFILPLALLYLYIKLSKKLTSKIINHLIKE